MIRILVRHGARGWFAVSYDDEHGVIKSHPLSFGRRDQAVECARRWAEEEGLEVGPSVEEES